jgi:hypothetical protein
MISLFVGGANDGKRMVLPDYRLPVVRLAVPPSSFELRRGLIRTEDYSLRRLSTSECDFEFYAPVDTAIGTAVALLLANYPQPKRD